MNQTVKHKKNNKTSRHFNNISLNSSKFLKHFGNVLRAFRGNMKLAKLQGGVTHKKIIAVRKPLSPYIMEIKRNPTHKNSRRAMEWLGYLSSRADIEEMGGNAFIRKVANTIYNDFHNPEAKFPHQGKLKFHMNQN